ncbi:MAG: mandelate racemase/muconate lactonizing enzyme family protein [Myxococcota bacterium]
MIRRAQLTKIPLASSAAVFRVQKPATLLLTLEDEGGRIGFGEASPIDTHGSDTIERAEACLRNADWSALGGGRPKLASLASPSARFCVETALLDLTGQREGLPLYALLGGTERRSVERRSVERRSVEQRSVRSAQVLRPDHDALSALDDATAEGWRTVKWKLRPETLAADLEVIREAMARYPDLHHRTDGNRRLSSSDAKALAELDFALVEEPTEEPGDAAALGLPLGLDESLANLEPESLQDLPYSPNALVLKPTVLGGLARSLRFAEAGRHLGAEPIVSHALEGWVGYTALLHLAVAVGVNTDHGLGPHPGLDGYPARGAPTQGPSVEVPDASGLGVTLESSGSFIADRKNLLRTP